MSLLNFNLFNWMNFIVKKLCFVGNCIEIWIWSEIAMHWHFWDRCRMPMAIFFI